jgi:hypothetical protein
MQPAKFRAIILLIIALSCIRVSECHARVTIIPNVLLNLQTNYDSNFYYLSSDEKSVVTRLVEPGFEVGVETAKALIAARYTLSANYYDEAGEDDFYGHQGLLLGEVELTDRTKFDIKNRFIYTQDPGQLDPIGTPASREKYFQNRFRMALSYYFEPKFTVEVGYQNWITDYDKHELEDAKGNQGSIDLIYHLNRSSALDIEYQYWSMNYDGVTPDYNSHLLWFKYRKEWRLVALEAGVGYHKRSYDESGLSDSTTTIYNLILDGASRSGKSRYSLSGQQNYNYLGFHSNDYYKAYRFTGKYDYDWTVRITSGLEASYQNNDYINSQREDDIRKVAGDVGYLFKEWLELVMSLSYEERDSNTTSRDYDRLIALIELQFDYDIGNH